MVGDCGYLDSLRHRNYAVSTLRTYRVELMVWRRWLDEQGIGHHDATPEDIEQFLAERNLSPRSMHSYLSTIGGYYRWCKEHGAIAENPCDKVHGPRLPEPLPRPITEDDLARALVGPGPEMRLMILLAAKAGLRCKEIAGIRTRDLLLQRDPPVLIVSAPKGRRERAVPLHDDIIDALADLNVTGDYLFPARGHPELPRTPNTVSHAIGYHLRACGIDATAHQLRHRFGTAFYAETKDLRTTQELMGHRSPVTTAQYTKVDLGAVAPYLAAI